ncbi:PsiF family protein [Rhodanobacter sp. DHB23]|uniref:PsiF family protein n=1 Tax=Rhodanobacter sp. DHB23 TaxID=2775923 RepID=UPI001781822F|nr:PsiF family protein [Rhodanobacter sp. DHB23]MBD8871786.1 phosphate starvation-inducible protein PsiF [Rhodanobacter sp. DHB23]
MTLRFSQIAACAALTFATTVAFAAAPQAATSGKTLTPQQQRMSDCNKQATGKTGADRKTFMSSCLKGESTAAAPAAKTTQQEKMKSCSADAKTKALKGADRKTFMSTCLKGDTAAAPAAH